MKRGIYRRTLEHKMVIKPRKSSKLINTFNLPLISPRSSLILHDNLLANEGQAKRDIKSLEAKCEELEAENEDLREELRCVYLLSVLTSDEKKNVCRISFFNTFFSVTFFSKKISNSSDRAETFRKYASR